MVCPIVCWSQKNHQGNLESIEQHGGSKSPLDENIDPESLKLFLSLNGLDPESIIDNNHFYILYDPNEIPQCCALTRTGKIIKHQNPDYEICSCCNPLISLLESQLFQPINRNLQPHLSL